MPFDLENKVMKKYGERWDTLSLIDQMGSGRGQPIMANPFPQNGSFTAENRVIFDSNALPATVIKVGYNSWPLDTWSLKNNM